MSTPQQVLDSGDIAKLAPALRKARIGTLLAGEGGIRLVRETALAVASAACTPTYTVIQLLACKAAGVATAGFKQPDINGTAAATGHVAPNAGGTSIVFNAEATGTGTADVTYLTADPIKVSGIAQTGMQTDMPEVAV